MYSQNGMLTIVEMNTKVEWGKRQIAEQYNAVYIKSSKTYLTIVYLEIHTYVAKL